MHLVYLDGDSVVVEIRPISAKWLFIGEESGKEKKKGAVNEELCSFI
ncbi:MAG: hypothetical protein ABFD50_04545 [Smithella sp.]